METAPTCALGNLFFFQANLDLLTCQWPGLVVEPPLRCDPFPGVPGAFVGLLEGPFSLPFPEIRVYGIGRLHRENFSHCCPQLKGEAGFHLTKGNIISL